MSTTFGVNELSKGQEGSNNASLPYLSYF